MENLNSVCYVVRINEIKPIDGADMIEQVIVGGWNCISQKGRWKVDDLVVIATTDAVLPKVLSDSLEVTNYLRSGGRVRTIKLRGVYSECLIIADTKGFPGEEGRDMQDVYGVYKYEPPIRQVNLGGGRKIRYSDNPNFHVYYKFPNFKNVPQMFTKGDDVQITRKMHGTNARYGIVKKRQLSLLDRVKLLFGNKWAAYEFVYGSHNVEKGSDSNGFYDTNVWFDVANKLKIKERLWVHVKKNIPYLGTGYVIYGEIIGAGIQKGYDYGFADHRFLGFDVQINGEYLPATEAVEEFIAHLDLSHVPILRYTQWVDGVTDEFVVNNYVTGTKIPHEGVVVKHVTGDRRKIAKFINPDYLIYAEKHNVGDSH